MGNEWQTGDGRREEAGTHGDDIHCLLAAPARPAARSLAQTTFVRRSARHTMLGSRVLRTLHKPPPISFWAQAGQARHRPALVLPGQVAPPLPPKRSPQLATPPPPVPSPVRPPRSATQVKTLMVEHFETRHPRRALHLFRNFLAHPPPTATATSVEGLVWLFFTYRQPELAIEALARMHEQGRRIPVQLCSKALRTAYDRLATDEAAMIQVFGWLKEGITGDDAGERLDDALVETVLEALARLGRDDWVKDLFETYLASLPGGEVGADRIWSTAITAVGSAGDVDAAEQLFRRWRSAWHAVPRPSTSTTPPVPPPEGPYLALLRQLALSSRDVPQSLSRAYAFLPTIADDGLAATTGVHNALLHLELTQRAFPSFWAIWSRIAPPPSADSSDPSHSIATGADRPCRDQHSWRLAIRARTVQHLLPRSRARVLRTPLSTGAALPPTFPPSHRTLLRELLSEDLAHREHRPSLLLPTTTPSLVTRSTLNDLLELLIAVRDWPAASVVLETFRVRRLEPSEATHAAVVLGVVRHWEKGKIRAGLLREAHGIVDGPRRTPQAGLAMVGRILQGRQMRVGLWMRKREELAPGCCEIALDGSSTVEIVPHDREPEPAPVQSTLPAPAWMLSRELRDLSYLLDLLKRCEGLDDVQWAAEMTAVRTEVLPARARGARRSYDSRERLRAWKSGRSAEDLSKDLARTASRYRSGMRAKTRL